MSSPDRAPRRRHVRATSWIARAAALVGLVVACGLGLGFLRFASTLPGAEGPMVRHADALVALTGGSDRVAEAVDLLVDGQADRLLITGVNPATSPESLARRIPRLRKIVN